MFMPATVQHRRRNGHARQRGAEIGLLHDQQAEQQGGSYGRKQHVLDVFNVLPARFQEVGEIQDESWFSEFRWL